VFKQNFISKNGPARWKMKSTLSFGNTANFHDKRNTFHESGAVSETNSFNPARKSWTAASFLVWGSGNSIWYSIDVPSVNILLLFLPRRRAAKRMQRTQKAREELHPKYPAAQRIGWLEF
jgi:hypothetical protein